MSKLALLFKVAVADPMEAWDRVMARVEVAYDRHFRQSYWPEGVQWNDAMAKLSEGLGVSIPEHLDEGPCRNVEREVVAQIGACSGSNPIDILHSADFQFGRLYYALARATKPDIVVETGVALGVSTAFMLAALQENGCGYLHSVDLPPLVANADAYIGSAIPEGLRSRWRLHRGSSRRVLPRLLAEVGPVDIFFHDSLHTYRTISWELNAIVPHLSKTAVVLADDVEQNRAYLDWQKRNAIGVGGVVKQASKNALTGYSVLSKPQLVH